MTLDMNILKLFTHGNSLIFLGALLLLVSLLMVVRVITGIIGYMAKRQQFTSRRQRLDLRGKILLLLAAAVVACLASAFLMGGASLKTYVAFNRADQIGIVECLSWDPRDKRMIVSFTFIRNGQKNSVQTYSLYGDQWEVSAHIVKWEPRLNLLGLHTAYRLSQIKGSYLSAGDESRLPHRAYALTAGKDWLWWSLTRFGEYLPLVEAVYGNAVAHVAKPGERFDVFVTTAGLSTRRRAP